MSESKLVDVHVVSADGLIATATPSDYTDKQHTQAILPSDKTPTSVHGNTAAQVILEQLEYADSLPDPARYAPSFLARYLFPSFTARALYAVRALFLTTSIAAVMLGLPELRGLVLLPVAAVLAYFPTIGGALLCARSLILGTLLSAACSAFIMAVFDPNYYVAIAFIGVYSFCLGVIDVDLVLQRMGNATMTVALLQWANPVAGLFISDIPQIIASVGLGAALGVVFSSVPVGLAFTAHHEFDRREVLMRHYLQSGIAHCTSAVCVLMLERLRILCPLPMAGEVIQRPINKLILAMHALESYRDQLARMNGCLDEIEIEQDAVSWCILCSRVRQRFADHLNRRRDSLYHLYATQRTLDRIVSAALLLRNVWATQSTSPELSKGDIREVITLCGDLGNACQATLRKADTYLTNPSRRNSSTDAATVSRTRAPSIVQITKSSLNEQLLQRVEIAAALTVLAELKVLEASYMCARERGAAPDYTALYSSTTWASIGDFCSSLMSAMRKWENWNYRLRRGIRIALAITLAAIVGVASRNILDSPRFFIWAPLTVCFLLSANDGGFYNATMLRLQGTLLGTMFGYIIAQFTSNPIWTAFAFAVFAAVIQYPRSNPRTGYWAVVASLTAAILLFAFRGLEDIQVVALARLTQTVIGVAIMSIVWALVFPISAKTVGRKEIEQHVTITGSAARLARKSCVEAASRVNVDPNTQADQNLATVKFKRDRSYTAHGYQDSAVIRGDRTSTVIRDVLPHRYNLLECNAQLIRSQITFERLLTDMATEPQQWWRNWTKTAPSRYSFTHKALQVLTDVLLRLHVLATVTTAPQACLIEIAKVAQQSIILLRDAIKSGSQDDQSAQLQRLIQMLQNAEKKSREETSDGRSELLFMTAQLRQHLVQCLQALPI